MFTLNLGKDRENFQSRAENLLEQNRLPEALSLAEEQRRYNPLDVEAIVILGDIFIRIGELGKARDMLTEVEQLISGLAAVYARMADVYRENGFKSDAAFCYRKFIGFNPISEQAAEIAEKLSFLDHQEYKRSGSDVSGIENTSRPGFFTMTLAELYIKQGHLQMAREVLGEIIKRDPGNINAAAKLFSVESAMSKVGTPSAENESAIKVIETLSSWLANIDRLNAHATGK